MPLGGPLIKDWVQIPGKFATREEITVATVVLRSGGLASPDWSSMDFTYIALSPSC